MATTVFTYPGRDLETLATLQNYHEWIVDEARPFLGSCIAEIGAGLGTITDLLIRKHLRHRPDARLEVFEPARNLYRNLEERLHDRYLDLLQGGRLKAIETSFQPDSRRFDTILMINVLEHIEHDREFIRLVYQSLERNGVLIVFVPALQWLYSEFDKSVGHHRRYEKDTLCELMRAEGFQVVKSKYMDLGGVLPWFLLNVLGKSATINGRLARIYDRWFVPCTRWIEDRCGAFLGKNVFVVGRKRASTSV